MNEVALERKEKGEPDCKVVIRTINDQRTDGRENFA